MAAPPIGTYIRPVPLLAYCYQVVRINPPDATDPREQLVCKRFGYDSNGQPVKDGHQDLHYLSGLKEVFPGVWKGEWEFETPRWSCCPLYWKHMSPAGQQDLFA